MLFLTGIGLIVLSILVAKFTELVFPSIMSFSIGFLMMLGGTINDTLKSEIQEYQYQEMLANPYMIEYAKEHKFFDDGKISIQEYQSIPKTHLTPNKDKVLEMSSK